MTDFLLGVGYIIASVAARDHWQLSKTEKQCLEWRELPKH